LGKSSIPRKSRNSPAESNTPDFAMASMQAIQLALLSSLLPLLVGAQEDSHYDVPSGGAGSQSSGDTNPGADGEDNSSITLSSGGLIAIIVVVVVVVVGGGKSVDS
jgi:hypothetical protein